MEKSEISFGNRTGCQCNSTPGVKVIEYYPCVNSHYNCFFYFELIACALLFLLTRAVVIIFEYQVAFLVGTFSQTGQLQKDQS